MAAPLTLSLESKELRVGDVVRGEVRVEQDLSAAEGLDVELVYTVRHSPHVLVKERLVYGAVHRGQVIPFELTLTEGPYSWDMPNVSVTWKVKASADIAWRIDPKVETDFVVRPRKVPPDERMLGQLSAAAEAAVTKVETGPIASAILWLLIGAVALAMFPLLPIALILWARSAVTRTRVRDVQVVVPERRVAHGEWVPVVVRFHGRRPFQLEKLDLTFSGSERWTTGSGDSRRSHRKVFHTESQTILVDRIIAIGAEEQNLGGGAYRGGGRRRAKNGPVFEWRTGFRLPPNGPPSAGSGLTYDLKLHLDIAGLPDVAKDVRLKTLGAQVEPLPPAGDPPPPEQTSGELTFLRPGEPVPAGVDARLGAGGLMRWVLLSFVGVALGIGGIVGLASGLAMAAVPFALGGALLAFSVGAFLWTLYR
ncbi:MAG: hypothetical protein JJ863_11180 [Deltaproteobacteria bacterium]|nr:hypothetical protein [Deltaproteobacteria bacterium]